jgi:hypothetical protein
VAESEAAVVEDGEIRLLIIICLEDLSDDGILDCFFSLFLFLSRI